MNKVEYGRVYIFYNEKRFFANLNSNIKVINFSKFTWESEVIGYSKVQVICREPEAYR